MCAVVLVTGFLGAGCGYSGNSDESTCIEDEYGYESCEDTEQSGGSSGTSGGSSEGTCQGTARMCASFGRYSCSTQPGCSWSSYSDMCTGYRQSCNTAFTQAT